MERRTIAQRITTIRRLEDCGRVAYSSGVALRLSDGVAGVAGVQSCGSVWVCSVCSAKIAGQRQAELAAGLKSWWDAGNSVAMLTLTMRHGKGDALGTIWDTLSGAWGSVTSGRAWMDAKKTHRVAGYVRVAELTHTKNGWHLHVHVLLLLEGQATERNADDLGGVMIARWVKALERRGSSALAGVQDIRLCERYRYEEISNYLTKQVDNGDATAREIHQAAGKTGKSYDSRTPFGILDDLIRYGDAGDAMLWAEYEAASLGRRQVTYGRGTRALLGLGVEKTDEEIADEEEGTADDDMVVVSAADWWRLSANGTAVADVLDALESGGIDHCLDTLALYGVAGMIAPGK